MKRINPPSHSTRPDTHEVPESPTESEHGPPSSTPFAIPKNDIKASMIMDCTPGSAADPEPRPPPPFHIGPLDGFEGVDARLSGGVYVHDAC